MKLTLRFTGETIGSTEMVHRDVRVLVRTGLGREFTGVIAGVYKNDFLIQIIKPEDRGLELEHYGTGRYLWSCGNNIVGIIPGTCPMEVSDDNICTQS